MICRAWRMRSTCVILAIFCASTNAGRTYCRAWRLITVRRQHRLSCKSDTALASLVAFKRLLLRNHFPLWNRTDLIDNKGWDVLCGTKWLAASRGNIFGECRISDLCCLTLTWAALCPCYWGLVLAPTPYWWRCASPYPLLVTLCCPYSWPCAAPTSDFELPSLGDLVLPHTSDLAAPY